MNTVSIKLMGGLGNMLFQIATAQAVSFRDNKKLVCGTDDMIVVHKPYSEYTDTIFRKILFSNRIDSFITITENHFNYSEIERVDGNIKLQGYFQSEKYFIDYKKEILNLFEIDDVTKKYLFEKYGEIPKKDTCSIHVRRGDYLQLQNHHPVLSIDYYREAIELIGKEKKFYIFSDDVQWCEENFNFLENKEIVTNNLDYQDLYFMSMCEHNIIANSSFSWWGAWMNENENKKVICPSKWFGSNYSYFDTSDLYCKNWILL